MHPTVTMGKKWEKMSLLNHMENPSIMVWVTLFIENKLIDEIGNDISDFAYRNDRKQQEHIIKLFHIIIAF